MKKVLLILFGTAMMCNVFGGVQPKIFDISNYTPGETAIKGDTIWARVTTNEGVQIEKRLISTKALLATYTFDGLSSTINKIKVDPKGRIWVCTNNDGIAVYENDTWTLYDDNNGLPDYTVYDVYFDGDTTWVGTWGGLGKYYDGTWESITETEGLPENYITSILRDLDGNLWVGTGSWGAVGLCKWDGNIWTTYGETEGLGDDRVNTMILDNNGKIWVGTYTNGISEVLADTILYYGSVAGIAGTNIEELAIDSENNIWASDNNGNLSVFDGATFVNYAKLDLLNAAINNMFYVDGKIHIATKNGIVIFDGTEKNYVAFGYPNLLLDYVSVDKDDNVWVAIDNAHLIYVKDINENWTIEDPQTGLSHSPISKIDFAPDGSVWVGTTGNGIFRKTGDVWVQYSTASSNGLGDDFIYDFSLDSNGYPWVATDNGAYHFNGTSWTALMSTDGLESNSLYRILVDNDANVWIGYYYSYGVSKYDGSEVITYTNLDNNLASDYVNDLALNSEGKLIVGTSEGISTLTGSTFTTIDLSARWSGSSNVNNLYVDAEDNIYAAKGSSYYFAIIEQDTTHYMKFNDLGIDVSSISEDSNGDLWMGSYNSGLIFLRQAPKIDFTYTDTICIADTLKLTNSSDSEVIHFAWDIFNDETIDSSSENFTYKFVIPGDYKIRLSAANTLDTNYIVKNITVLPSPEVSIESSTGKSTVCEDRFLAITAGSYSTYKWNTNAETALIIIDTQGVYTVTVTNEYGCSGAGSFELTVTPKPTVTVSSNSNEGAICPNADVTLTAETDAAEFIWENQATTQSITVTGAGTYSVTVTDAIGCTNSSSIDIMDKTPYEEQLGVVTASDYDDYVIVAWEKTGNVGTRSYNVYRQEVGGYDSIGNISFNETAIFTDESAEFKKRAYTYKITAINECGSESPLEACIPHTSMHLLKFPYKNSFQLLWTPYKGIDVESYTIYQTTDGSDFKHIETIPAENSTTYTVIDYDPTKTFRVSVDVPEVDPVNIKSDSGPYSQSLSNLAESQFTSDKALEALKTDVVLFPVPVTNVLNVAIANEADLDYVVSISNPEGKIIESKNIAIDGKDIVPFTVSDLAPGVYSVCVTVNGKTITKQFMKK